MSIKGPIFPSFRDQQRPTPKQQWLAHDGRSARARRLKQIRAGTLKGPAVTHEARLTAHGLLAPSEGPPLLHVAQPGSYDRQAATVRR